MINFRNVFCEARFQGQFLHPMTRSHTKLLDQRVLINEELQLRQEIGEKILLLAAFQRMRFI